MTRILYNVSLFAAGMLLYVRMIHSHNSASVRIAVTEIGSMALFLSGFSLLNAVGGKPRKKKISKEWGSGKNH